MDVLSAIAQIRTKLDEIEIAIKGGSDVTDTFYDWEKRAKDEMICNVFLTKKQWKNKGRFNAAKNKCMLVLHLRDKKGFALDEMFYHPSVKKLNPNSRQLIQEFIDYLKERNA